MRGVQLVMQASRRSGLAPRARSARTAPSRPFRAAQCRAVKPQASGASGEAPEPRIASSLGTSPSAAAAVSGDAGAARQALTNRARIRNAGVRSWVMVGPPCVRAERIRRSALEDMSGA
jgi:hypothetical protein